MQKREFEEMIERTVSDAEYKVIETVYQWHPSVKEVSGKEEVAELYKSFGIAIFHDMLPRAEKNRELENKLRHVQAEMEELSRGNAPERFAVTPKALEEHLKMEERQRERDRKAIELSEKLPRLGGLCVVEPEKYGQFLRMDWYEMSRFVKDWIDFHMDDIELTPGLVERMFKTPLNRYQRGHNLQ